MSKPPAPPIPALAETPARPRTPEERRTARAVVQAIGGETPVESLKRATTACLRAIGGRSDITVAYAPVSSNQGGAMVGTQARLPSPPARMEAVALTRLRGTADALALRLRHHDAKAHARRLPIDSEAREVYDALEQARVEALGGQRFKGVAANIAQTIEARLKAEGYDQITDPAAVPLGELLRLAAHRRFRALPMGPTMSRLIDLCAAKVLKAAPYLDDLGRVLEDQAAYAKTLRKMLDALDLEEDDGADEEAETTSPSDQDRDTDGAEDPPQAQDEDDSAGAGQSGEQDQTPSPFTPEPLETDGSDDLDAETEADMACDLPGMSDDDAPDDASTGRAMSGHNSQAGLRYKAYTTTYDQVREATELCDPEELTRLRFQLDQNLARLQGVVARLANRLQRRLMAQQQRSWAFDLEEGVLDVARLARVVANPSHSLSYKMEKDTEFRDTVVSLLIDNSGSMRGRPISVAAMSADILARTLERCGVKVEILGFTTSQWKGGKSREQWLRDGKPDTPGRLNDLRHIIYKAADQPWRRARRNLGLMLKEGILKENIDGEALLWAHNRLIARPEQRRILMVISDGAPVDDSTLSANPGNYLERHLREVIALIETRSPVQLLAIGIGHDVTRYYNRAVTISDAEDLGGTVLKQLAALFEEDSHFGSGSTAWSDRRMGSHAIL